MQFSHVVYWCPLQDAADVVNNKVKIWTVWFTEYKVPGSHLILDYKHWAQS